MTMTDSLRDMFAGECLGASFFDWDGFVDVMTEGRIGLGWVALGLLAQLVIVGCLVVQWYASRKRSRIILPVALVYVWLIAVVMLLVYASIRHDVVFVAGQLLNVMIALRLIELLRRLNIKPSEPEEVLFPVVEPDSAERMLPPDSERSDPNDVRNR
jgi:lipid-A-disaccharide synthase-like uncharacterized protein